MTGTTPPPRTPQQRRRDTTHRLEHDIDAWVATADPATAAPYLVPLSFDWDGTALLLATAADTRTARNLAAGDGRVRVALGELRDVVLIDAVLAATITAADIPPAVGDAFAARTGFDPRALSEPYLYLQLAPERIMAWREANELAGRVLMRDGRWVTPG